MALNVKALLKKKGWTGEEVGRALMASLVHDFENLGKPDSKPLFTQAELEQMERSLGESDFTAYGVYRYVYSATVDFYNRSEAYKQQFYNGYYRYLMHLKECIEADNELSKAECFPLILTQEQYNRYSEQTLKGYQNRKKSFSEIIFDLIDFYLQEENEAPKAIADAMEATKSQSVTNKRILENYNEDIGNGYYILPDGRRSDQMNKDEWQEALTQEYMATHKLVINGEQASPEETAKYYNMERMLKVYKLLFSGEEAIKAEVAQKGLPLPECNEDELIEALVGLLSGIKHTKIANGLAIALDYDTKAKWVTPEFPPSDLTKYDILTDSGRERYGGIYSDRLLNGEYVEEISEKEAFKEFIKDYPKLFIALKEEAEKLIASLKGIKPAQYTKEVISLAELAAIDMPISLYSRDGNGAGVKMDIAEAYAKEHPELDTYAIRMRTFKSGIAIIQGKEGDYTEPKSPYSWITQSGSLDAKEASEEATKEIKLMPEKLIKPAMRYLYAYNALIDILSRVYAFDGEKALQVSLVQYESQIEAFNNLLYMLFVDIYGDEKEKKRKRAIIRDLFSPIYIDELKPKAELVNKVEEDIRKLGLTQSAGERFKGGGFEKLIIELAGEGANIL